MMQSPVDLAVLDIKMPRMDGMELLEKLRKSSDLPVIFLTSQDDEVDELMGLRMGADDYIKKPFSQRLLIERIRTLLRREASRNTTEKTGEAAVVVGRLSTTSVERAREAIDMLKKKAKSAAIVLAYEDEGRVTLLVGVTDDLTRALKAGDIVKTIAPIVDGGGGGKPQLAQAGGKNPAKIDEALKEAVNLIKQKLT